MKYILMVLLMGLCLLLGGCREGSAPQPTQVPGEQSGRIDQEEVAVAIVTFTPVPTDTPVPTPEPTDTPSPTPVPTDTPAPTPAGLLGGRFDVFSYGEPVREADRYAEENIALSIRTEKDEETYQDYITYHVVDIYVQDVTLLRTAAAGKNGFSDKNTAASVKKMSDRVQALFAASGDFYTRNMGLVVRNGELYRKTKGKYDICVLYRDGVMATYTPEEYEVEDILAQDPWQVWTFGPGLLDKDGGPRKEFPKSQIKDRNPRCVLGYYEPGHYAIVLIDGRQPRYSMGLTMEDLAVFCKNMGFAAAYNLDGGQSAVLCWQGEVYNRPADGGRSISDVLYVASQTAAEGET